MTYSPNMAVIARIARTPSIPRPRYDVDRHGNPITEETERDQDTPDKKPRGFLGGWRGRLVGGRVRLCLSCGLHYPMGPLCGACWALVRTLEVENK